MPGDVEATWRIQERRSLPVRRSGTPERRNGEPRRASDRRDPHAPPVFREGAGEPERRALADRRQAKGPRRTGGGRRVGEIAAYRRPEADVEADPHPSHRPPAVPRLP